ncbi:transposase [Candidatus Poribacteria bacterium]|nr:transposase [Candidatus Poribacteria bacterium]
MSNWRPNFQPEHLYFVTTKAVDYAHIFRRDVIKRLLVDTLDCFRLRRKMQLFCFVIMPNHLHFIAQFSADQPLENVLRDFKRQTADRLIRHLKVERNQKVLDWLRAKVKRPEKQSYKVWEDGYNAKDVISEDFLLQKMTYIHNNPCQPHWELSTSPESYIWSSAGFYLTNSPCIIPIDDVRKLLR